MLPVEKARSGNGEKRARKWESKLEREEANNCKLVKCGFEQTFLRQSEQSDNTANKRRILNKVKNKNKSKKQNENYKSALSDQ